MSTVDTTGPGGSFAGALLCEIIDDKFVLEDKFVLKFANACKVVTTTKKGAVPTLSSEGDVLFQFTLK